MALFGKGICAGNELLEGEAAACPSSSMYVAFLRFRPLRSQHSLLGEQVAETQ